MEWTTGASTTGWIKIDLQGADSAHYYSSKESETRPIVFPDGLTRLITMERGDWEAYDTVRRAWRIGDEQHERIFSLTLQNADPGHPHFEPLLQYCFQKHIRTGWERYVWRQKNPANHS